MQAISKMFSKTFSRLPQAHRNTANGLEVLTYRRWNLQEGHSQLDFNRSAAQIFMSPKPLPFSWLIVQMSAISGSISNGIQMRISRSQFVVCEGKRREVTIWPIRCVNLNFLNTNRAKSLCQRVFEYCKRLEQTVCYRHTSMWKSCVLTNCKLQSCRIFTLKNRQFAKFGNMCHLLRRVRLKNWHAVFLFREICRRWNYKRRFSAC